MHDSWDNGALNCLACLLDNTTINDWEGEFVDSLHKKKEAGAHLTEGMRAKLFEIYAKREI